MATEVIRYVDTGATGLGTGLSWTDAYTSLADWDAAVGIINLVSLDQWLHVYCRASTGVVDNSHGSGASLTISQITTDPTHYILIEAEAGNEALKTGWDFSRYRVENVDDTVMYIGCDYVRINGLQISTSFGSEYPEAYGIRVDNQGAANDIRINGCRIKAAGSGFRGIGLKGTNTTATVSNTIITGGSTAQVGIYASAGANNVFNTIIEGFQYGLNSSGYSQVVNCAIFNSSSDNISSPEFLDHCATDLGEGTNPILPKSGSWNNEFVSPTGTSNFTLKATGNLIGAGASDPSSGIYTTDMEGDDYRVTGYSIGVDDIPSTPFETYYRYVDPDASGLGTGLNWTDAYTGLQAWSLAEATSLVAANKAMIVSCRSTSGTADTTSAIITEGSGWATSETHNIIIQSAPGWEPEKEGWNDSLYRLVTTTSSDYTGAIHVGVGNIEINGLQIRTSQYRGIYIDGTASAGIKIGNCRIDAANTAINIGSSNASVLVWNTILESLTGHGIRAQNFNSLGVYNSIVYGTDFGISNYTSNELTVTNCAVFNNNQDFYKNTDGLSPITVVNSASDDGEGTNPISPSGSDWTNEFTDPTIGNFAVSNTGNLYRAGIGDPNTSLYNTDIDGEFYNPSAYTIGIDEPATYIPPPPTEKIRYVDTDAVGSGDGTSWTDAYTSLFDWELAEQGNLVTANEYHIVYCRASSGTEDSTFVLIDGTNWITDATHTLRIEAADTDRALKTGLDITRYRLVDATFENAPLEINTNYVTVDGLQLKSTGESGLWAGPTGTSDIKISNCLIVGYYYSVVSRTADTSLTFWNCIFISRSYDNANIIANDLASFNIYNSVIYQDYDGAPGLGDLYSISNSSSNPIEVKNTAIIDYNSILHENPGLINLTNCASDQEAGINPITNTVWLDEFPNYETFDFTLSGSGDLYQAGIADPSSGLYTTDIEGDTYNVSSYSIGIDEPEAPVSPTGIYRYVDTGASGTGDGTSWIDAYTRLSSALSNIKDNLSTPGDLVTSNVYIEILCRSSNSTTDDTPVQLFGTTTDETHYISVKTDTTDRALKTGWDSSRYTLECLGGSNFYLDSVGHITIDGLQIRSIEDRGNVQPAINVYSTPSDGKVEISNCRIDVDPIGIGINVWAPDPTVTRIWNTIIENGEYGASVSDGIVAFDNCVISGNDTGLNIPEGEANNLGIYTLNCAIFGNTTNFSLVNSSDQESCASDTSFGVNPVLPSGGVWTNEFVDSANGDYTLLETGNLYHGGTTYDTGIATDIDGDAYNLTGYSIGVDEPVEVIPPTEKIRYVDTVNAGSKIIDGLTWETAYSSLESWELAERGDLVTSNEYHTVYCRSSAGSPDPDPDFTISNTNWTTGPENYINIVAADTDRATKSGWDLTKYRIEDILRITVSHIRIDGLQLSAGTYPPLDIEASEVDSDVRISNCYCNGNYGQILGVYSANTNIKIWNTIMVGSSGEIDQMIYADSFASFEIYNCIIQDLGWWKIIENLSSNSIVVKNSVVYGGAIEFSENPGTYIILNTASGSLAGTNPIDFSDGLDTNEFSDPEHGDFTLLSTGNFYQAGLGDPSSGIYTTDMDGEDYNIGAYSIGVDEPSGSAPVTIPIILISFLRRRR